MRSTAASAEALEVARAAADWLTLLESGRATEDDHRRLQHWRSSHASHETVWQRAQSMRQRFAGLPPDLAMASLDRPDVARRAALKRALLVAALVPGSWLVSRQLPLQVWRADLSTATGERRLFPLADGSTLQLNTDSAVNLDLATRTLTLLRGELALKVPGSQALVVQLPYGQVSASRSELCIRRNDGNCLVSVFSGQVRLQPLNGPERLLNAGQQMRLQASGSGPVETFEASLPGWREGVLIAQDQPLGDFLRELGRFRPGLLRWEPELENLRVTGSFRLDDTDKVLALLAASLPLQLVARTRYWVTLVPRKNIA